MRPLRVRVSQRRAHGKGRKREKSSRRFEPEPAELLASACASPFERAADLNDRDKWPEYVSWLVDKVDRFKKTFGPRVKKLNLNQVSDMTSAQCPETGIIRLTYHNCDAT